METGEPMKHKPYRFILIALMILMVGTVVVVALLRDRFVNQPQWQVTVAGQGKVSYQPDIALVTLGVQIDKAATADSVLKLLNDKLGKILPALADAGIGKDDIQTQNYNISPQYNYIDTRNILVGYSANQQLVVKVRSIDSNKDLVGMVVSVASKAGANQVLGISFDVSNVNDLKQQARIKAIEDARSKAGALADASSVRLGKVIGWWENIVQAPGISTPYYGDKGGMGGGAMPQPQAPTGLQEIIIEMSVNYRVK